MSADDLTCKELVELVSDYIEGALPPHERTRFDMHLRQCPHCTRYVEQMRDTIRITGALRESDVTPEAKDALLAAFRGWKRK